MLEFDTDSWHRKWKGCAGILASPNGEMFQDYYNGIEQVGDKLFTASLAKTGHTLMGLGNAAGAPVEYKGLPWAMPMYIPFVSGVYHPIEGHTLIHRIVMWKNHNKCFSVGVNGHTYTWIAYSKSGIEVSSKPQETDLLREPEIDEFNPGQVMGVLSRKLWWQADKLMWVHKQIGFIKGWDIMLDAVFYIPFIQPLVGPKCQLKVL